MPNLKNKVVLITGANRGQGKSITKHLNFLGAKTAVGSRNFQDATSVSQSLENKSIPIKLDITKEEDWKKAVSTILEEFGQIDILVNNAGVYHRQSFLESTLDEYEQLIKANQIGTFLGMKNVANQMKKQQQGSIINTVSISSFSSISQSSLYASTKAAVTTMSKATAIELDDYGVRFNMIHPEGVDTRMFSESKGRNSFYNSIPLHRIGQPIDIAKAIAFFASDESLYCTGAELVVGGGMTLGTDV